MDEIKLSSLLNNKKYRKVSQKRLTDIISGGISYDDFNKLKGSHSWGKAEILYEKWHSSKCLCNWIKYHGKHVRRWQKACKIHKQ